MYLAITESKKSYRKKEMIHRSALKTQNLLYKEDLKIRKRTTASHTIYKRKLPGRIYQRRKKLCNKPRRNSIKTDEIKIDIDF